MLMWEEEERASRVGVQVLYAFIDNPTRLADILVLARQTLSRQNNATSGESRDYLLSYGDEQLYFHDNGI
jgi:hypothetical protein